MGVQKIPSDWTPYKNRWGNWVWAGPGINKDPNWPGQKAPSWVSSVVYQEGIWYWKGK